jgi:hypothetical protein
VNKAAKEEAHAHDEKKVGQDGSQHRSLDDLNLVLLERNDADLCRISNLFRLEGYKVLAHNQFHSVTKCSIQQTTQGLAEFNGDFFGSKGQDGGEGDNGKEVDGKDSGRAPAQLAGSNANRDHDEEEVDIVCSAS